MFIWWPKWMTQGRCFNTAPKATLQLVIEVDADVGVETLSCGHKVYAPFPLADAPAGTYRRSCPRCDGEPVPDLHFPAKGGLAYERARVAKERCNGAWGRNPCPVRARCLAYAVDNNIRFGVWGGASYREREAYGTEVHEVERHQTWVMPDEVIDFGA